jgi:hypothetical protein
MQAEAAARGTRAPKKLEEMEKMARAHEVSLPWRDCGSYRALPPLPGGALPRVPPPTRPVLPGVRCRRRRRLWLWLGLWSIAGCVEASWGE